MRGQAEGQSKPSARSTGHADGDAGSDATDVKADLEAGGSFALGRRTVNRIGYGAMQLAGDNVFGPPGDRDEALRVLRAAIESGINHIDTAQYYGPDVVNNLIREALYPYPTDLAIVSKVAARRDDSGAVLAYDEPDELRAGVKENLVSLGLERLAAVNLRVMDDSRPEAGRGATRRASSRPATMGSLRGSASATIHGAPAASRRSD